MKTVLSDSKDQAEPLEIVLYPDPFLAKRCREITPEEIRAGAAEGWKLAELYDRMVATMYHAVGIGLAAPQIGVGLRLFIVDVSGNKTGAFPLLNPVLSEGAGTIIEEEGCLSIPDVRAKVKRFASLKVNALDLGGKPVEFQAADLLARVCQHENDHLDGKLFIDHLRTAAKFLVRRALADLEADYALAQKKKKAGRKF